MMNRTCPWLLDNGSICQELAKDQTRRVGLCDLHSSVQYMTQLATQGRLLTEAGVTEHSPGFTYVALTSDGNYRLGYAGSMELIVPKLRKTFRFGEPTRVVTLLDGGKSRYLSLVSMFSPFWIEGVNSTYTPDEELTRIVTELPLSDRYSDLPRNMTGQADLFD